jgi:hypothetical protein
VQLSAAFGCEIVSHLAHGDRACDTFEQQAKEEVLDKMEERAGARRPSAAGIILSLTRSMPLCQQSQRLKTL